MRRIACCFADFKNNRGNPGYPIGTFIAPIAPSSICTSQISNKFNNKRKSGCRFLCIMAVAYGICFHPVP